MTTPPPVPPLPPVPPPPGPRPGGPEALGDGPITDAPLTDSATTDSAIRDAPIRDAPAGDAPTTGATEAWTATTRAAGTSPPNPPPPMRTAGVPGPPPPRPPVPPRAQRDRRPYKAPSGAFRVLVILVGGVLTALLLSIGSLTIADTMGRAVDTAAVSFPSSIRKVVIDVDHGSIVLRGSDREDIRGEREVTRGLQVPAYDETVTGDTLTIESACPVVVSVWCEVGYDLDVPAGVDLDLTSGAGRIEARGFTGSTRIKSGAGTIRVDDLTGRLDMRSGAGSVNATRLKSPLVSALSGAGSVNLEFAEAPQGITAEAGAGSVDIEVPRDGATYRIDTEDGEKRLTVAVATDPQSSRVIRARSGAGSITIHHPVPGTPPPTPSPAPSPNPGPR